MTAQLSFKTATNDLGFSVISDGLHAQLFPNKPRPVLTGPGAQRVYDHYKQFGVALPPEMPKSCEHEWQLPKLQGPDLRSHFEAIGKEFAGPYDAKARLLIANGLPPMPAASDVLVRPGWYMYIQGQAPQPVEHPLEDCYVFDCETYVLQGAFPIICVAASSKAWYIWLDPALCDLELKYEPTLFPIGDGKLVVGHNATYDFQRSIESHWLDLPAGKKRNYFLCTMSMNIVTHGYSGPQRWVATAKEVPAYAAKWASAGCANSLLSCYNFHCWPETPLTPQDKKLREMFVVCDLPEIRANFLDLINYAMLDVFYTWELFASLYPKYRQKRPSWIALAGVIQQSAHNLPVVDDWFAWVQRCEDKLDEYEKAIDKAGRDIADDVYKRFVAVLAKWQKALALDDKQLWALHNTLLDQLKSPDSVLWPEAIDEESKAAWLELMLCPWLGHNQIYWAIKPRVKQGRGRPEWHRNLGEFGRAGRLLHQFIKIEYKGFPVFWGGKSAKWCYKDAAGKVQQIHKFGTENETGQCLLNREHAKYFEAGDLVATAKGAERVIDLALAVTYWVSTRGRVMSQIVSPQPYKSKDGSTGTVNVITPDLIPTGTVSGRGVSPLWLTVTDCKKWNVTKIGPELKSRVQAPPGKVLMSADMSAQELRIGAIYADSIGAKAHYEDPDQAGYIGSSLMSHGVYAGNKELGTDPHTLLAKSVGVSRDGAKTAGYALLYGAGARTIAASLIYNYMNLPLDSKGKEKLAMTKANEIITYKRGKTVRGTGVFTAGTDSAAYTVLAKLGSRPWPETPLLGNKLTAPLCPANCGNDFLTGRSNWSIQASARDQADCLTVAYQWLCDKHGVDSRVLFLIHDEFLTVCDEQDINVAAWLFSIAHCWTWAFMNEALGIYDMCSVGTFFDDIIVQKCLRKAHDLKTNSASNPVELEDMPDGRLILEWDLPALNDEAVLQGLHYCAELYS